MPMVVLGRTEIAIHPLVFGSSQTLNFCECINREGRKSHGRRKRVRPVRILRSRLPAFIIRVA